MGKRRDTTEDAAAVIRGLAEIAARDEAARREIGTLLEEYTHTCREVKRLEWCSPWRLVFLALGLLTLVALVEIVGGGL